MDDQKHQPPITGQSVTGQSVTSQSVTGQSVTGQSVTSQSVTGQSGPQNRGEGRDHGYSGDDILQRKQDHIDFALDQNAVRGGNAFDQISLVHDAMPEVDFDAVVLKTRFLGFDLDRPFLISSMTGGPARAETINRHLAEAASALGIAMGVGSQRIHLETGAGAGLAGLVRRAAVGVPLFANLGAAQLRGAGGVDLARRAVDSLEADALIVHLNPLQEVVQRGGDRDWTGVADGIAAVVDRLGVPVLAKEVGCGISRKTATKLKAAGVSAIDVAGRGGTDFCEIEARRADTESVRAVAAAFRGWGLSTPQSLQAVGPLGLPVIASGGIRHGLDAAKAIALGATIVGQAGQLLSAALTSTDAVIQHFEQLENELRAACLLTGSADVHSLSAALDGPV